MIHANRTPVRTTERVYLYAKHSSVAATIHGPGEHVINQCEPAEEQILTQILTKIDPDTNPDTN